jgi:N-acetylglucosaminyl-diphospho-decaprenol L-rhamnosyltransferase
LNFGIVNFWGHKVQYIGDRPNLSIIIVNWNSASFVRKCVASLHAQALGLSVETIVIDNASYDGCGEMIAREFPSVQFIQGEKNYGFGRANNVAFLRSRGQFLLFLNPDTEVYEGAIQRMVQALTAKNDVGVVGAKLLNSDGTIQTSCIQNFPSILGSLLDSDLLRTLLPRCPLWGMRPLFDHPSGSVEVDAISGACQMMRREVFLRAHMYSTAYFMYAEDVDLCLRVNQLGLRNLYVPDAVLVHHGGKSSSAVDNSDWSAIVMRESLKRYFEQNRSHTYARLFQLAVGLQAAFRVAVISLAIPGGMIVGRAPSLTTIKQKWMSILRWALGREQWACQLSHE